VTEEKLFGCRLLRQLGHRIIPIFSAWFVCKQEDLPVDIGECWVVLVLEFHRISHKCSLNTSHQVNLFLRQRKYR